MRRLRVMRGRWFSSGGGLGLLLVCLGLAGPVRGQTLRLGNIDLFLTGRMELGYESNIDGAYPEEEDPDYEKGDFYWSPGLTLRSSPVAMRPTTTLNFGAAYEYMDYFQRNDEDTELYNLTVDFQTVLPRITLGGSGMASREIESEQDSTYRPGGSKRDPMETLEGTVFLNWNVGKLRVETHADYSRERHDKEEYKADDQDETTLFGGIYWDVFSWGSLYYSWENVVTEYTESGEEQDETTQNVGLTGAIPLSWLRHPKITYSFGFEYEEVETADGESQDPTWEPTHTITVMDEFQLTKAVNLSFSATWEDTWTDDEVSLSNNSEEDDEVTFEYNVQLSQQLGPRAQHAVSFEQEPRDTFGSTADTETTTYGYVFGVKDILFYGLSAGFSAEYELSTPLDGDEETEKTTTIEVSLGHSRQLSRRLSRTLAYTYSWENSNFHDDGAKEEHVVTYGLDYQF